MGDAEEVGLGASEGVAATDSTATATLAEGGGGFTPEEVRAAFRGAIPAKRLPTSYRLWTLIVACVMVALPLIYVAIVGAVGYVMYWHATHNHVIFQNTRGKAAVMGYFGPLVVLGTLLFFLAKPLFARRARPPAKRSVTREEEPALFALVDGVCKAVGAPKPVRIDVDCEVNASAGPESGLFSLLRRRLVLTIGLPLVSVFEADQFAGVLAHEFGHFAQSAGMKLTYVIRSVNAWFARVVYERDAWDEGLNEWSTSGNIYSIILANFARLLVWASRRILWVLMYVGHAVSCTMARQMEFDADRCEAFLAGSATSAGATRRLRLAGMAHGGAMSDLSECWKEGRLPDDLPRLIEANIPQIPEAAVLSIDEALASERTGVFDTHPADKDRIAAVLRLDAPGVFHMEGPATAFFRDFDALSREATVEHYQGLLGEAVEPERLQPYREIVRGTGDLQAGYKAFKRVYVGTPSFHRVVPLPAEPPAAADDLDAARGELERLRGEQAAARAEHDALLEPEGEDLGRRIRAEAAVVMLSAGYRVKPDAFGLKAATVDSARSILGEVDRGGGERSPALDEFDALCGRRTAAALGVLDRDDVAAALDGGEALRDEARALLPIASTLAGRVWPALRSAVQARGVMLAVLSDFQGNEKNEKLHQAIRDAGASLHARLNELKEAIGDDLAYPFDHARKGLSIAEFALPAVPDADEFGGLLGAAEQVGDRLGPLYMRILSRLATAVERAEAHLGLPALAFDDESGDNRALE